MTFKLEIASVRKFSASWSWTKPQDFGTHVYLLMHGPTLHFAMTKTYGPISVDLREKQKIFFFFPFSLSLHLHAHSTRFLFLLTSLFLFILFFFNLDTWLTLCHVSISHLGLFLSRNNLFIFIHGSHCIMCPSLIRVCFFPETIYLFSVQFILNELSSNHFMTS